MILYEYQISPYSEMIRLMLGYAKQPWRSHRVSPYPPRKTIDELSGGYRRIPIAQVGADIFCDSTIIADEIAEQSGIGDLSLKNLSQDLREFVHHTHDDVFMSVAQTGDPKKTLGMVLRHHWPWDLFRLVKDRGSMFKNSNLPRRKRKDMREEINAWLQKVEASLEADYILGASPTLADFAAFHVLWFAKATHAKDPSVNYSEVQQWYARMQAFGHGEAWKISRSECWQEAKLFTPRELPNQSVDHELLQAKVSIAPSDYGLESVNGELVWLGEDRAIIARQTQESGLVHVHFPIAGYTLKKLN